MRRLKTNSDTKALLFGLAAVACWSTVATAFKVALSVLDPFQLVFYANLTAIAMLFAIVAVRGQIREITANLLSHWRMTLIASSLNPTAYYLILFSAYELLPAQVAMSINYSWAIVLTLMTVIFLKQQVFVADWIAAFVCYSGVFVIATGAEVTSFREAGMVGLCLALLSTVIWAGYWTVNIADERDSTIGLTLNFLVALPVTGLLCATFSELSISYKGILAATYVGLIEMAIAFVLWSIALKSTANASRVSNLIFLSPFLSLIIINQILDEAIMPHTVLGLILIFCGLIYQQSAHTQTKEA